MCNLPVQNGPKCGAYAAAYYLYFKSNNRDSLNEGFINNDIYYQHVKFAGDMEGSDPMRIKSYLKRNPIICFNVNVYVSERIDDERLVLLVNMFARNANRDHSLNSVVELKDLIGEGNYAITLWYPANFFEDVSDETAIDQMLLKLPQMHYMLTKVDGDQLYVVDSNNPNIETGVNWCHVSQAGEKIVYTYNNGQVNKNYFFTGLVIK